MAKKVLDSEARDSRPDGTKIFELRVWYREKYLRTTHWEERRHRALEIAQYQCECCHATGAIHIHHLSYHNLFEEPNSDLMVLCSKCHKKAHDEEFERTLRLKTPEEKRRAIKKKCSKITTIPKISFNITSLSRRRKK